MTTINKKTYNHILCFKCVSKTYTGDRMLEFLHAYTNGKVKHLDRYRIFGYYPKTRETTCLWLGRGDRWPDNNGFIPTHVKYERKLDLSKWEYYRKYKDLFCAECEKAKRIDGCELMLCHADLNRISICQDPRPCWCPVINGYYNRPLI